MLLGCGGWVSNPLFGTTSLLVRAGGLTFLLDAGEGVYASLKRCGFDISDIDYVLVTHKHGDHVLGLPTLLVHAKRLGKRLKLVAPADLDLRALLSAVGIPDHLDWVEARLIEPPAEPVLVLSEGAVRVYAAAVEHSHPALAYRVEAGGASLVYTGDTKPSRSLVSLARGCDLLIHEASYNPGEEQVAVADGHSTTRQALEVAASAGAKYLMPVHFRLAPVILEEVTVKVLLPLPCTPVDVRALASCARSGGGSQL